MGYVAVTLARSGSKGVKDKNILKINNISVSHFPMVAAEKSTNISRLVYSSDSTHYLDLAKNFFDRQNFKNFKLELHLRSKRNASDEAGSWTAIKEIVSDLNLENITDNVTLLAATCPTITSEDINFFFTKIDEKKNAMSVRELDYPIENTFMSEFGYFREHEMTSHINTRQEKKSIYRPDGHIYFRPLSKLESDFPNNETQLIHLNKDFYSNIDTQIDYQLAKLYVENSL